MTTKRKSSLILLLIFVVSILQSFSLNSMAASSPTVYSPTVEATAGEEIRVPIYIKNNSGIVGWGLTLNYDENVLTPKSIEYGSSYGTVITGGMQNNIGGDAVPGSINIFWAGSSDETYNGIMFYAVFDVSASAVGEIVIDISYSQADTFNENFEDIVLNCESIKVKVKNNQLQNFVRFSSRTSANELFAGETFSVFIGIDEINGMSSADLSIKYDVVYEYDTLNFDIVSVEDISGTRVFRESVNNFAEGILSIPLENLDADMVGKDIVEIKIASKEKAAAGEHIFAFTSSDTAVVGCECKVTIKPTADSETALVYSHPISAKYNETINIPVCIKYNKGLMGYRLNFDYDTSVMEFVSAAKSSLFSGNFDYNADTKGHIEALWNNSEEITDSGEMMVLSFRVITEEKCTSLIEIGYSQPDTFNEQYEEMLLDCQQIEISLNPECKHSEHTSVVTKAATCTADGERTCTCLLCNETYTEVIPKLGHSYASKVTKPANCTTDGARTYTCSKCSDSYTAVIPKLGHSYTSNVTKVATCKADGETIYTCSNCSDSYTEVIAKLGHDYKSVVTTPTCEAGGYTTHTCSRCNDTYKDSETAKIGHNYMSVVSTQPDCENNGVRTYACLNCNDRYQEIIPKLGHNYDETEVFATCTEMGYTVHVCSNCNNSYKDKYVSPLGHDYDVVVMSATCLSGGYTEHTCQRCEDCYTDDHTNALSHDFGEWITIIEPQADKRGLAERGCSRCEETEQKILYYATPEISFNAAEKIIRYGETLVVTLNQTNIPEGVTVEWYIDGNGVYSEYNEEENAWYITAIDNGFADVVARVIDENGERVLDENGDEITAEMKVTVKSNFFLKIISFFKNLFRMNRFVW